MNAEQRLLEWARDLHYPGQQMVFGMKSIMGRTLDDGPDGAVQGANLSNDGGAGALVDRLWYALMVSNRCRETAEAIVMMSKESRDVIDATYRVYSPRDLPRSAAGAAEILGISERTYWTRKKKMLAEFAEKIAPSQKAA